jgi:hypothetical protein
MATTIDALVITLGLDPTKFNQGQKAALDGFKKTNEEALRVAKDIEASGKKAASFFSSLKKEVIGLLAAFGVGTGLRDFGEWIGRLNQADTTLGKLALRTGQSAKEIRTWQVAAELLGDSAQDIAGDFESLNKQVQHLRFTGEAGNLPLFNTLGVSLLDSNGKLKTTNQLFDEMVKALAGVDAQTRAAFISELGFSQSLQDLGAVGTKKLAELREEAERLNRVTKAGTDDAQALTAAWNRAGIAVDNLGKAIKDRLAPYLTGFLSAWGSIFRGINPDDPARFGPGPAFGGGGAPSGGALPLKPGATGGGTVNAGTLALAASLNETGLVDYFSALNDLSHAGGKHREGLAFDMVLKSGKAGNHAAIAEKIQAMLGADAFVLDEYDPAKRSAGSTGPHIHVQFANAAAAGRYAARVGGGNTSTSSVNVGTVVINTQATDATGITQAFKNWANATHADTGAR